MNRIVREHYPVAGLPKDLQEGLPADASVRVTIEAESPNRTQTLSLDQLFAMSKPPYRSVEQIVEDIRRQRDDWDA